MIGIYAIKNNITNQLYIGQSTNISKRLYNHKSMLLHNKHDNIFLQRSYNKYGANAFCFEILEQCCPLLLNKKETEYYEMYVNKLGKQNVFNLQYTGNAKNMSDETKKKISETFLSKWKNKDYRLKQIESHKGHIPSKETRLKMSKAGKNRVWSLEIRQKISVANKNPSVETRAKRGLAHRKKIILDNKLFDSVSICANYLNVSISAITNAIKRKGCVKGHKVWYANKCSIGTLKVS